MLLAGSKIDNNVDYSGKIDYVNCTLNRNALRHVMLFSPIVTYKKLRHHYDIPEILRIFNSMTGVIKITGCLCLVLGFMGQTTASARQMSLGRLPVKNFTRQDYRAGTQTWAIEQGPDGVMYFANNAGLVRFDGTYWRTYPIGNKTNVRSVKLASDGRIYVGGQGDLGYFHSNESGHLVYRSLKELIPEEDQKFEDVWEIEEFDGYLFFRTWNAVFRYSKNREMRVFRSGGVIEFMGMALGRLYVQDSHNGLLAFQGDAFTLVGLHKLDSPITSFLAISEDQCLITTLKQGIFTFDGTRRSPWPNSKNAFFKEKRIYAATPLANGQMAIGTTLAGLVVLDAGGRTVRHIDKDAGLQNSNILSLYNDRDNNLWCGLDNGIDYVQVNSPFTQIHPDFPLNGSGYDVAIQDGNIYFATTHGLYVNDWKQDGEWGEQGDFRLVQNTAGQAWGISVFDGNVLLNHHEGAFRIVDNVANRIFDHPNWDFLSLDGGYYLGGHYNGFSVVEQRGEFWHYQGDLKGVERIFKDHCVGGRSAHLDVASLPGYFQAAALAGAGLG